MAHSLLKRRVRCNGRVSVNWTPNTHTQPQAFWTQSCRRPQQSGGWSNDFNRKLASLQPRCINILWGDPGWCMHMSRTLLRYQSLPGASCHHVRRRSPSPHISDRTIPRCGCIDTHSNNIYPDEQKHQVSLYLVVWANPKRVLTFPALSPLPDVRVNRYCHIEVQSKLRVWHSQHWCKYIGSKLFGHYVLSNVPFRLEWATATLLLVKPVTTKSALYYKFMVCLSCVYMQSLLGMGTETRY